jgi:hypothetical protein
MRGYVRFVVSALLAAVLLFAPTAGASAACRHAVGAATSVVLATARAHADSSKADCDDHAAPSPRPAGQGASCAAVCALPAVTNILALAASRATAASPLIASLDAFAAGLAIPPLLGPPRT